jgi:hypothetical protein
MVQRRKQGAAVRKGAQAVEADGIQPLEDALCVFQRAAAADFPVKMSAMPLKVCSNMPPGPLVFVFL